MRASIKQTFLHEKEESVCDLDQQTFAQKRTATLVHYGTKMTVPKLTSMHNR